MHTVCECTADVNPTTQAYSAVIGPSVVLAKPVFPWWQSSKISSEPMNLVQGSTHLNLSAPHPHYCSLCIAQLYTKTPLKYQIQNNFLLLRVQTRAALQWTRLINLLTLYCALVSSDHLRCSHFWTPAHIFLSPITHFCLYSFANFAVSTIPPYHVSLIIKHLQNLCSSNDQLTSF